MEKLEIFGKKYQIQSGLSSEEVIRMYREIVKRLKTLSLEYPRLDKVDILVLYVIELNEKIIEMEKVLKKEVKKIEEIRTKIFRLEGKIKEKSKKS
ncbi:MAG: cell division protein ZapA [Candidatus Omnitrophica bacterium]|nr:cell division protein ZapA [Candidatus Omnitrophota bacterium]